MSTKSLVFLPLLLLANTASGQSLYLTCKATTFPDLDFKKIYKSPSPITRNKFILDMGMEGLLDVLVNKAESWQVNVGDATVSSPRENSGPKFSNATITEVKVSATEISRDGTNYSYEIDRITGKLTYSIQLTQETLASWRKKHGGSLPQFWEWEQSCTSSSRPKL